MTIYARLPSIEDASEDQNASNQQQAVPVIANYQPQQSEDLHQSQRPILSRTSTANTTPSADGEPIANPGVLPSRIRWSNASTIFGIDTDSLHYSFSPARHNEKAPTDTARPFKYWRQMRRLSRLTIGEWLLTAFLCGMMALVLRMYERKKELVLGERHTFNAITTGVSLLIGINLAASLRSYAKLLRWRLLSYTYRPLETFDLVLGCDSLFNILELIWKARNESYPFLPSWTQTLGVLWLATNLSMTIFVGMVGLNYNLDTVDYSSLTKPGNAWVRDLASIVSDNEAWSLEVLQAYGASAMSLKPKARNSTNYDRDSTQAGRYGRLYNGTTQYYLYAYDADLETSAVSRIFIRNDVMCTQYPIIAGQLGDENWFTYNDTQDQPVNVSYPGATVGTRGLLTMSSISASCGPRCTFINIFQAGQDTDLYPEAVLPEAYFYKCNSTISPIGQVSVDGKEITNPPNLQILDNVSRMFAGSIGWSAFPTMTLDSVSYTYQSYANSSTVWFRPSDDCDWLGDDKCPTVLQQIQDLVSCFNMGAIIAATMGYVGLEYHEIWLEDAPAKTLTLTVEWPWTVALLAGVALGQLVALIVVLLLANKSIIRDDSHLAISKIYYSLLKRYDLGERGCMLHTEELIHEMHNPKVAYTWKDLPDPHSERGPIGHLDVYEQPLYRFKIKSGQKKLRSRPEFSGFEYEKYYD